MALTLEQLEAKRDQILQSMGLAGTQAAGRSVQYSNDEQKKAALSVIEAQIAELKSGSTRGKVRKAYPSSGW